MRCLLASLSIAAICLFATACTLDFSDAGCSTDDACRDGRVCSAGVCVSASENPSRDLDDASGIDTDSPDSGESDASTVDVVDPTDTAVDSEPAEDATRPPRDAGSEDTTEEDTSPPLPDTTENARELALYAFEYCAGDELVVLLRLVTDDGSCEDFDRGVLVPLVGIDSDERFPQRPRFEFVAGSPGQVTGCGPGDLCIGAESASARIDDYAWNQRISGFYDVAFPETNFATFVSDRRFVGNLDDYEVTWCSRESSTCR
jgi:hypothetical protein